MSINYRTDASYVGVKRSFKLSVKLRNYGMTSVTFVVGQSYNYGVSYIAWETTKSDIGNYFQQCLWNYRNHEFYCFISVQPLRRYSIVGYVSLQRTCLISLR